MKCWRCGNDGVAPRGTIRTESAFTQNLIFTFISGCSFCGWQTLNGKQTDIFLSELREDANTVLNK